MRVYLLPLALSEGRKGEAQTGVKSINIDVQKALDKVYLQRQQCKQEKVENKNFV